jgi:hypothetical protein
MCKITFFTYDILLWCKNNSERAQTVGHNYVYVILLHATCFGFMNNNYEAIKNIQILNISY